MTFPARLVWLGVTKREDRFFVRDYSGSEASSAPAEEFASVEDLRSWLQDREFRPYINHPPIDVELFEAWQ